MTLKAFAFYPLDRNSINEHANLRFMKTNIKYILVVIILPLIMSNQLFSQNEKLGSWVTSVSYITTQQGNELLEEGYVNYKLDFNTNGISGYESLSEQSLPASPYDFEFSVPALSFCNKDLQIYLTGMHWYDSQTQHDWATPDFDSDMYGDVSLFPVPNSGNKYILLYCAAGSEGGSGYSHGRALIKESIEINNGTPEFSYSIFEHYYNQSGQFGHFSSTMAVSNYHDDKRTVFVLSSNRDNWTGVYGLQKYSIDNSGLFTHEQALLLDDESNGLAPEEYLGFNMEMRNKSNPNENILAWITGPFSSNAYSGNIYIFNNGELIKHEMGIGKISGIEFSPVESSMMYVSSENEGLIKIDWHSGSIITTVSQGFSHTAVQTAPDGNVYSVSNDGSTLGQINKTDLEFNPDYFEYPINEPTTISTHINFYRDGNDGIRIFTLPDNDHPLVYSKYSTTDNLCDIVSGSAIIEVFGGTPDYVIIVEYLDEEGNWVDVSDLFFYTEEAKFFEAPNLPVGNYRYKISDQSYCESEEWIEFEIKEGDIYDFEQDLLEIDENASTEIYGLDDMVWDASDNDPDNGFIIDNTIMFKHGFVLKDNQTLTINDLRLEFDEDYLAKVIVEPGSKLILNNCTLTNYHCWDPDAKWAGIEVWGNSGLEQTDANQGRLELNNTIIEHAHEAVQLWQPDNYNSSGGMISAVNSNFLNNHRAVVFMAFKNIKFGVEWNYESSFRQCIFENDTNYIMDNPFLAFVTMWKVRGVQFTACEFNNSSAFPDSKAIYTLDAGYHFKGKCTGVVGPNGECISGWQTNTFTNFLKAIESANTPKVPQYSINIWDSDFENNQYGIFMTNVENAATVLYNQFYIGNGGIDNFEKNTCGYFSTRGIQMNESFGFNIEENEFDKMPGNIDSDIVGVLVNKCPSDLDDIYLNEFYNLTAANQAEYNNRLVESDDHDGVTYLCNSNSGNTHDFYITNTYHARINGHVGSLAIASGNTLSNTSINLRNDGTQDIRYYYWAADPAQVLPNISQSDYVIPIAASNPNECLSNYGNGGGGIGIDPKLILTDDEKQEVELEFYESYQDYESVSNLLEQLKDGGSTETTSLTIATAQPDDTWELRSNLLGMSPYLSKEVLMEAADRTDVLPESVLFEILSANPDELRKADLMEYLENKEHPLPDYMIAILRQMSNGSSAKTALLSQKAVHYRAKAKAAQKMIRSIKNEEELDVVALRNWLGNMENYEADKQIVATYLYVEDYTNADVLLDLIPDLYDLQGEKLDEYNDYVDLLNLQTGLKQQNRNIFMLTEAEKSQLINLAENSAGDALNGARSILSFVYGNEYCDCITPIEGGGNKSSANLYYYTDEDIAKAMGFDLQVKPNPARVYSSVDYKLPIGIEHAELQLINTEGKIVLTERVSCTQGQNTIDVSQFKAGAYIIRLVVDKYSLSESLIIE